MTIQNQIKRLWTHLEQWTLTPFLQKLIRLGAVIYSDSMRCDLLTQASAMAYVTLISLIPSLVAIFCVFSLFTPLFMGQRDPIQELQTFILSNLASGSGSSAVAYLKQMLDDIDLKTIGLSSFISVLLTLILLLRQIEITINEIWFVKKLRNPFVRFIYFLTFLILTMLAVGALIGLSIPNQFHHLIPPQSSTAPSSELPPLLQWLLSFSAATLFFFLLYKFIPHCKVKTRSAMVGALVAALLIHLGSYFYGLFVRNSASYKTLYGALAQLPIFLTWLYVCWTIILLGALISWRVHEGFPDLDKTSTPEAPKILT